MSEPHRTSQPPQGNILSEQEGWVLYNAHDLHELDCIMLPCLHQRHGCSVPTYPMGRPVLRMRFEESELSHTIQQVTESLQFPNPDNFNHRVSQVISGAKYHGHFMKFTTIASIVTDRRCGWYCSTKQYPDCRLLCCLGLQS